MGAISVAAKLSCEQTSRKSLEELRIGKQLPIMDVLSTYFGLGLNIETGTSTVWLLPHYFCRRSSTYYGRLAHKDFQWACINNSLGQDLSSRVRASACRAPLSSNSTTKASCSCIERSKMAGLVCMSSPIRSLLLRGVTVAFPSEVRAAWIGWMSTVQAARSNCARQL